MQSKRSLEGYLLIDNGGAPNISAAEAAATGREIVGLGARGAWESATVTCSHCQRVVVLNPERTRERGYCQKCDHYICDAPECRATCRPYKLYLDQMQERAIKEEAERASQGFFGVRTTPVPMQLIIP